LRQSDAILSAKTLDLDTRNSWALVCCGRANHPRQRDQIDDDRGCVFSPSFANCVPARRLLGAGGGDGS
jgi:hypothetical protein